MALLSTKLKNQLKKEAEAQDVSIDIFIQNISVNGEKRGCDGHIVNKGNGSCVYLNTEESCYSPLHGKAMYRLAEKPKDWSSNGLKNGFNRWCKTENLAKEVIYLLKTEKGERKQCL